MNLFEKLGLTAGQPTIDWDITPAYTFTFFESWGSQRRIRSLAERYYYFFIDNWEPPPRLFLMERGIKFARVLAEIRAPQALLDACIASQGTKAGIDRTYAIDGPIRDWLTAHVVEGGDECLVVPVASGMEAESLESGLPRRGTARPADILAVRLDPAPRDLTEEEIPSIILRHNFFDSRYNPVGSFRGWLVDNDDGLTVTDLATGLMWQRGGLDIASIRGMQTAVRKLNDQGFAGHSDWRLPSLEEALSLFLPLANAKGLHAHPCFSKDQPFIFLAAQRLPGGYWFADFKQGNIFWASGFNPGGFGRLCRTVEG